MQLLNPLPIRIFYSVISIPRSKTGTLFFHYAFSALVDYDYGHRTYNYGADDGAREDSGEGSDDDEGEEEEAGNGEYKKKSSDESDESDKSDKSDGKTVCKAKYYILLQL